MAKDDRRYSRVYHEALDDPKFRDVWDNDARLALWLRLLVGADASWPASATLPRSARRAPLDALVGCGLVDLTNGSRYRIHGLDAERTARSNAASNAAAYRWHSGRNADAMPSKEEKRREETRQGVDVVQRASLTPRGVLDL